MLWPLGRNFPPGILQTLPNHTMLPGFMASHPVPVDTLLSMGKLLLHGKIGVSQGHWHPYKLLRWLCRLQLLSRKWHDRRQTLSYHQKGLSPPLENPFTSGTDYNSRPKANKVFCGESTRWLTASVNMLVWLAGAHGFGGLNGPPAAMQFLAAGAAVCSCCLYKTFQGGAHYVNIIAKSVVNLIVYSAV